MPKHKIKVTYTSLVPGQDQYQWTIYNSETTEIIEADSSGPPAIKEDACNAVLAFKERYAPDGEVELDNQTGDDTFDKVFNGEIESCAATPSDIEEEEENLQEFVEAQNAIPIQEEIEDPEDLPADATHYVHLPPHDDNKPIFAVLRAGFIKYRFRFKPNFAGPDGKFDTFRDGSYAIDQKYFNNSAYISTTLTGAKLDLLENGHPIQVIREGFGAHATFHRVAVWNYESQTWNYKEENNPAFIDSRILKRPNSYWLEMEALDADLKTSIIETIVETSDDLQEAEPLGEEAEATGDDEGRTNENGDPSLPVYSGITWNATLPLHPVKDPDINFVEPDWTAAEMCQPILNRRTCEYNVTVEVSSEETAEDAKRKGIKFLLNYYGKKFYPALIDRLMYLGGKNYSNLETQEVSEGLFASVRKEHASNRDDGIKKYLIAIPQTYFDHPWLIPDETNMMSRQEYLDNGLISYSYSIENKDLRTAIFSKGWLIDRLIDDLDEFKRRINRYRGTVVITSQDIDKKIERIKTFKASVRKFLELNGESLDDDGVIDFALDSAFKVVYVEYDPDGYGVHRRSKFLRKGINCINTTNQVFEDPTTSAYLFYAKQIREAVEKSKYPGIELVQKFTYPIPNAFPSKKSSDGKQSQAEEQEEKDLTSKSVKTLDDVRKKNAILGDTGRKQEKAMKASLEQFIPGDEIFTNFDNLLAAVGTITELFDLVLNKVPLFNLLAKAALCLLNKLGIDDMLETITNAFLSMINAAEMLMILTNRLLIDLMEKTCPGAGRKVEIIINNAFQAALNGLENTLQAEERESIDKILDEIVNARFENRDVNFKGADIQFDSAKVLGVLNAVYQKIIADLKEINLLTCLLNSLCEAIKQTKEVQDTIGGAEKFYDAYKQDSISIEAELIGEASATVSPEDIATTTSKALPGSEGFLNLIEQIPLLKSINCEILVMILETKVLGTKTEDEIIKKNMDQIGFRLPPIEYSDDPMGFLSAAITKSINEILNETLTPIIKVILEELGLLCQGLNVNTPLENEEANEPNYGDLSPDELENLPNFFDQLATNANLPGDTNILDGINPAARQNLDGVLNDIMNSGAGIPLTPAAIAEMKNLIDVLSNILRPTEICTLLSGHATNVTLRIILKLVQARPEFALIAQYLKSTDDISKVFHLLGKFANQNYCSTATEDISLIAVLCEENLNQQLYCQVLQKKGFTPEQCQKIIDDNKNREKDKLAALQDMLSADSLSDYFQNNLPNIHCTPDTPGAFPVNNDYMDGIINLILDSVLGLIQMQFEAEARGIKSVLIKEEITPYGGQVSRPPELGRDYMNSEIPTGSIGTPMEGKLFTMTSYLKDNPNLITSGMLPAGKGTDEYSRGQQIIANWPMIDKVDRLVTPRFVNETETIRTFGSIGYIDGAKDVTLETKIASKKFIISINHLPGSLDSITFQQKKRINELAQREGILEWGGHSASTQAIYEEAIASLNELIEKKNLVEYRLPAYSYLQSEDAAERNIPYDFCSFKVTKMPIKKKGNKTKSVIFNIFENSQDSETIDKIEWLTMNPETTGQGSLTIGPEWDGTLQEYVFAKTLSLSLEGMASGYSNTSNIRKMKNQLEETFASLYPFILSSKQNEIVKECLNSRFFSAFNLDKLIATPLSEEDISALQCSDYPNVNLNELRKSLLDFDEVKSEVKDFYDDLACETDTRDADDVDPLDDAIRYGMILISIRLVVAEIVFRSLFFFSRYDAEEAMANSSIFSTLIVTKLKEQADSSKINPKFFKEIKEVARKKLIKTVTGHGKTKILSNTIIVDTNQDLEVRQFSDLANNIINLADISALKRWLKHHYSAEGTPEPYKEIAEKIFENNSLFLPESAQEDAAAANEVLDDADTSEKEKSAAKKVLYQPILVRLQNRLDDLALKNLANQVATKMVPKVNSLMMDKDRKRVNTKRTLLSSNTVFDVPSDLVDISDGITRQGYQNAGAFEAMWIFHQDMNFGIGDIQAQIVAPFLTNISLLTEPRAQNIHPGSWNIDIIDYKSELNRIEEDPGSYTQTALDAQNICLDAYDLDNNFYAHVSKSTFYNKKGKLTELGRSTKNGGFIVQKFIKVRIRDQQGLLERHNLLSGESGQYLTTDNILLKFRNSFLENANLGAGVVTDIDLGTGASASINKEHIISHKQFDIALTEAAKYAYSGVINNDTIPEPWIPGYTNGTFQLIDIFEYIKYGVRLVYVMPHDIDAFTLEQFNEVEGHAHPMAQSALKEALISGQEDIEKTYLVARGAGLSHHARVAEPTTGAPIHESMIDNTENAHWLNVQIENLLIAADKQSVGTAFTDAIRNFKVYQIKEPVLGDNVPTMLEDIQMVGQGDATSSITTGVFATEAQLGLGESTTPRAFMLVEKHLKQFNILPIPEAEILKDATFIEDFTWLDILKLNHIWQQTNKDLQLLQISASKANVAFQPSIAETAGISTRKLVDELFETPYVKLLDKYALSSTNLLNFAILQQAYFPYSDKFDFDDLFDASKQMVDEVFNDATKAKNDWSTDMDLSGWSQQMNSVMSAQVPEGAFFQWLIEVIPKFILRYFLASTDPCMKDAFDQQDENEWDDKKLPEIVFGSLFTKPENCSREFDEIVSSIPGLEFALDLLGISVPGDTSEEKECLPGIRPTPLFPVGFPMFGDASKPITLPGLIYVALQFLRGFDQDINLNLPSPDAQPEINIDPNLPSADKCGPDSN